MRYPACFKIAVGCKRLHHSDLETHCDTRRLLLPTGIHGCVLPIQGREKRLKKSWERQAMTFRKPGCVTENRTRYALAARCWGVWKPMITGLLTGSRVFGSRRGLWHGVRWGSKGERHGKCF